MECTQVKTFIVSGEDHLLFEVDDPTATWLEAHEVAGLKVYRAAIVTNFKNDILWSSEDATGVVVRVVVNK
jgi:hypothetical protein